MFDQDTTVCAALAEILGEKYVLTGADANPWRSDWTGHHSGDPIAVVRPASTEQVSLVMAYAHDNDIPVVPVGGNTGLNGGAIAKAALALSLDRLNEIQAVNVLARTVTVGAGALVDVVDQAAEKERLCFPLKFGASGSAQIGGVLSTNAGGANVLRYGTARDLCLGIEAVLADGRIVNLLSGLRKDNTGFDLRNLMIGAEGQLGIITSAVLKLSPRMTNHATAMVAMDSVELAPKLLNKLQDVSGNSVEAFEFMTGTFVALHPSIDESARSPFEAPHTVNLLVELASQGGTNLQDALETVLCDAMEEGYVHDAVIAQNEGQRLEMWARREAGAEVCFHHPRAIDTDIALPLDRIATFLAQIEPALHKIDPGALLLAVGHLGDGNLHYTVHPETKGDGVLKQIRSTIDSLAVELGGTFSAEHGIGITKLGSMKALKDPVALTVMSEIKRALDPKQILNAGKTIPGV